MSKSHDRPNSRHKQPLLSSSAPIRRSSPVPSRPSASAMFALRPASTPSASVWLARSNDQQLATRAHNHTHSNSQSATSSSSRSRSSEREPFYYAREHSSPDRPAGRSTLAGSNADGLSCARSRVSLAQAAKAQPTPSHTPSLDPNCSPRPPSLDRHCPLVAFARERGPARPDRPSERNRFQLDPRPPARAGGGRAVQTQDGACLA